MFGSGRRGPLLTSASPAARDPHGRGKLGFVQLRARGELPGDDPALDFALDESGQRLLPQDFTGG